VNRSLYTSIDFQIPEEVWSCNPVDYFSLRILGCLVYAHVNNGKLGPRAVKCTFLGYAFEFKGYRMCCHESKKVIQSGNVTFNETAMLSSEKDSVVSSTGAGDQEDTSMEIEVEIVTVQGGATNQPNREA